MVFWLFQWTGKHYRTIISVHGLQKWLGMVNYYSAFIPKFAHIIAPLTDLLKGHPCAQKKKSVAQLQWSAAHKRALDQVSAALASPPVLRLFDPACPKQSVS